MRKTATIYMSVPIDDVTVQELQVSRLIVGRVTLAESPSAIVWYLLVLLTIVSALHVYESVTDICYRRRKRRTTALLSPH